MTQHFSVDGTEGRQLDRNCFAVFVASMCISQKSVKAIKLLIS
jgi:hypothetical protein